MEHQLDFITIYRVCLNSQVKNRVFEGLSGVIHQMNQDFMFNSINLRIH